MAMNRSITGVAGALLAIGLSGCGNSLDLSGETAAEPAAGATPRAACGPGSQPETGLQGRVSQADHDSGRAAQGYTCNTQLVGTYIVPNAIGSVGGFKVERYIDRHGRECAYYDSTLLFPTNILDANVGVNVLDMSDPTQPALTARLITPAMLSPHESLVVSRQAGVLDAVMGKPTFYPVIVDEEGLGEDCRQPRSTLLPRRPGAAWPGMICPVRPPLRPSARPLVTRPFQKNGCRATSPLPCRTCRSCGQGKLTGAFAPRRFPS